MNPRSPEQIAQIKEYIENEFCKGKRPAIVVQQNPEVPRSTIYKWYQDGDWKKKPSMLPSIQCQPLHVVGGGNARLSIQEKFDKLEEILWEHATHPNDKTSVVVQSAQCLLKLFEAREKRSADNEQLSDAERLARINQMLDAARTRRAGQDSQPTDSESMVF